MSKALIARRLAFLLLVVVAAAGVSQASPRQAIAATAGCADGSQSSGAIYRICVPADWNGSLILFAHGFVAPQEPVGIPEDQLELEDGTNLPNIVTSLGYAFGTSSYRKNGLAILEGIDDLEDVVSIFTDLHGAPNGVYMVGASEGGLVTALSIERRPEVYSGGIAACGPVGDFPAQLNYFGDVRVVFDYFFPGVIPGSAINPPANVIANWETVYEPLVISRLLSSGRTMDDLIRVARIPRQFLGPEVDAEVIAGILWYNVTSTADAIIELGGQPFDNRWRYYYGSPDDGRLNRLVQRYSAEAAAVESMKDYQTTGRLSVPLVTLHTTGDPIVPYWHELLYKWKAPFHPDIRPARAGHCNFTIGDALTAFALLRLIAPP